MNEKMRSCRFYALPKGEEAPFEEKHREEVRKAAGRGIVLLYNNGCLPLTPGGNLALFGYGARHTACCGYGAASIASRMKTSIGDGLAACGFTITTGGYLDRLDRAVEEEKEAHFAAIRKRGGSLYERLIYMYLHPFRPLAQVKITEQDVQDASCRRAVFVITRLSGEGADRKNEPGDYQLTGEEKQNLLFLSEHFGQLIVVLNTVGPIDMNFLLGLKHLGAVLFTGLCGGVTGAAAADVLTGRTLPEGRLTQSWPRHYEDAPSSKTFGGNDHNTDDEPYSEDLFVGWRYYDTFGVPCAFPFGYGLSYTTFAEEVRDVSLQGEKIRMRVRVTNTGKHFAGRQTLQLYASEPEEDRPLRTMAGFAKTGLLQPGQSEELILSAALRDLAVFQEKEEAFVLTGGRHLLFVGTNAERTVPAAVLQVPEERVLEKVTKIPGCEKTPLDSRKRRELGPIPANLPVLTLSDVEEQESGESTASEPDPAEKFAFGLSDDQLMLLCCGDGAMEESAEGGNLVCVSAGSLKTTQEETLRELIPGASYTSTCLLSSGIPNLPMADGGGGLRLLADFVMDGRGQVQTDGITALQNGTELLTMDEKRAMRGREEGTDCEAFEQYTTALPMPLVMAQLWDPDTWQALGRLVSEEMKQYGVRLLLAPGMNIIRNPLGGRNFEYYSEDPMLSGRCAAFFIAGIQQDPETGACIKHLACNSQEENREGMNARVSERALREIYLRGFEIAVKKAHPKAVMTGHNLINGRNCAESRWLLTDVLRGEWGFSGLVMTDWGTTSKNTYQRKYGPSSCPECIKAGTDLIMPGSREDIKELKDALDQGTLQRQDLVNSAANVLRVIAGLYHISLPDR